MSSGGNSNLECFLKSTSPLVSVHYHTQRSGPSSSSAASGGEVTRPRIFLRDVWSSYEEWSSFGLGVPLSLENLNFKVTQFYAPSLSAIQIFTIKPFADDSSSRSSSLGKDGTETNCNIPNSYSNYKHRFLEPDRLGYLYFQYNETTMPFEREPLTDRIQGLAEQHKGLNSLTSLDLSPYSWLSVAWYPIYPIPSVKDRKELSACFLTYHSLTPNFPETSVEDDNKVKEHGKSGAGEVVLPPFGAVTYKAFGNAWNMPGTLDHYKIEMHEESASSWVETLGFTHSDLNFFMSRKFYGERW